MQQKGATKPNVRPAAISLEDIRIVKGLVGRIGTVRLKSLIDVFSK